MRVRGKDRLNTERVSAELDDTGRKRMLSGNAVAGYLAKYATKATEATGHVSRRLTTSTIGSTPTATTPAGSSTPAGASAPEAPKPDDTRPVSTGGYAAGHTCSASAATSSPNPAATPSPSASCGKPASTTAAPTTAAPNTRRRRAPGPRGRRRTRLRRHRLAHHRRRTARQHLRRAGPRTPTHRQREIATTG